jgi:hypothetical protein
MSEKTKLYKVVDDAREVLVTADKIKAALRLYDIVKKYEDKQTWFWVEEAELE